MYAITKVIIHITNSAFLVCFIVSIFYSVLYVFLESNWHICSKLLTDFFKKLVLYWTTTV